MRCFLVLTVLSIFQCTAMAQQRPQYVSIPPHDVLVAIASQPDCPVKIEAAIFS